MKGHCAVIVAVLAIVAAGVSANSGKVFERKPECPLSGHARIPHPTECTSYYICEDGESTIHVCPAGLHFNNVIKQCDWPSAQCIPGNRRPETQPNTPDEEDKEDDNNTVGCVGTCPIPDPMDETIHLPYRGDCTKFCKCSNGTPFVLDCPAGLHFDTSVSVCNWAWLANCQW